MQQRYRLIHEIGGEITLEYFPEGWNDLKYTVSRSMTYHGFMRSYSGTLRFVKDGKEFIEDILSTYGFETEIRILIDELDENRIWQNKINGILNFDPEVFAQRENYIELNFEDSVVHKKFKNRESLDVAYNRKESINGTILPGFASDSHTVQLRGQNTDTINSTCVYPFEAFNRIIQVICDLDYNPIVSSVFGRPLYGYAEDGKAALVMLSKGLLMRGATLAGDEVAEGETNLNLKFKELFTNYNNCFNLGLGTEYDSINERWNFVIEEKGYFYQTTELFYLTKISNLIYEYEPELMIQKISTGYRKFTEKNDYGLTEYNNALEFVTPISVSDTELNIENNYRADGIGFQEAIDNPYTGSEENETNIDEDIFLVHVFDDSGTLKSVKDENFTLIAGIYGANPIEANIYISPARNMIRWGDYIRSALGFFADTGNIRFNKAEQLSDLSSQYSGETNTIYENRDLAISDLKTNKFSGRRIKFEAPLTRSQINSITGNPYGLVRFRDYINKVDNYGWIKEVSTDRVDKDTTWELWEVANLEEIANNLIYMDGDDILLMDNSTAIKQIA
jgi:hypothetical protein